MIRIGNKVEGVIYTKRSASYVIIERKEDKKIAIATEGKTYFFLGGGIENEETEIEALKREVIEETGYSIKNIKCFDKVTAWAHGGKRGPLDVTATFYIANFDKKITEPIEKDHRVLWVSPREYKDKLFHEYQRYILEDYISQKGEDSND
ncbi:MAG: NUDIX domain-containing protein [Clostridia bacterium]|jgi:8-oxo-dGTP diphosphatase|nr:NUDIX domain-containing protein [Clostridia bacterium]